jgi:hypothetical protein
VVAAQPVDSQTRSLRARFGIERLQERASSTALPERERAQARLSALGTPQALQHLNAALLRELPRANKDAAELRTLIEALAPHANDPETRASLLRVLLGSAGNELRQMAALAIAAKRTPAALTALERALAADAQSAAFAKTALLAHPPGSSTLPASPDATPPQHQPVQARPAPAQPGQPKALPQQHTVAWKTLARDGHRMPTARLIEALTTAPETAPLAACHLAARDQPSQSTTLHALLDSPHTALRMRTVLGFGASRRKSATGVLLHAYRDRAWQVRWAALYALAQRTDAPSRRTLEQAASIEPNTEARNLARRLLTATARQRPPACPALLPLASLNTLDGDTPIANSGDLPEASRSLNGHSNPAR